MGLNWYGLISQCCWFITLPLAADDRNLCYLGSSCCIYAADDSNRIKEQDRHLIFLISNARVIIVQINGVMFDRKYIYIYGVMFYKFLLFYIIQRKIKKLQFLNSQTVVVRIKLRWETRNFQKLHDKILQILFQMM